MTLLLRIGILLGGLILLCSGLPRAAGAQSQPFRNILVNSLIRAPRPLQFGEGAWGDYDGDGDLDLILSGNHRGFQQPEPETQLFVNEGDSTIEIRIIGQENPDRIPAGEYREVFDRNSPILQDVWQSAVAWGDYDNDGDLDLAVSGTTLNGVHTLQLYTNIGDLVPFERGPRLAGLRRGDLAWADYDNDGDLDLAACGLDAQDQPRTVLYQNQRSAGALRFQGRSVGLPDLRDCSFDWGDYDNDGDLDVLVAGITTEAAGAWVYRNEGGDLFTASGTGLEALLFAKAAWGDYDNDGDLDVLVSGAHVTPFLLKGQLRIYRNDGGAFVDVSGARDGRYGGGVGWGDYNNDGLLDFFVTGVPSPQGLATSELYTTALGDRFFRQPVENFSGALFGDTFWGDYDGDGDLDLFSFGEDPLQGLILQALRNELPLSNTPPTAPSGLQATPQGNTVTLAWNPADDAQTPTAGLSYNLRVGTQPGGLDVLSPMALATSGHRLISGRGNAEHNTTWELRALAPGTYYWSVQAIDTSFKGSPFAQENTFSIGD